MEKTLTSIAHNKLIQILVQRREAVGMTQAELAGQLGEYQSFVARLESGQRRVDVVELIVLSKVLNFDPTQVVQELTSDVE